MKPILIKHVCTITGTTTFRKINGEIHNEDGPAIILENGTHAYYLNNKIHRSDGPAIEHTDGRKLYWLNGEHLESINSDEEFIIYQILH